MFLLKISFVDLWATNPTCWTYLAVVFLIQSSHSIPPQNGIWTICQARQINQRFPLLKTDNKDACASTCATYLALVQLFLELFHCVSSHHVTLQVIWSSGHTFYTRVRFSYINRYHVMTFLLIKSLLLLWCTQPVCVIVVFLTPSGEQ